MTLRRYCLMTLAACFLPGCSSDSSTGSLGGPGAGPGGQTRPLSIVATNASKVSTALVSLGSVEGLLPDSKSAVLGKGENTGSLPSVLGSAPNSSAQALALTILNHGPGLIQGPLGGSAEVVLSGDSLVGRFSGLKTLQGTINGEVSGSLLSGRVNSGDYSANFNFNGLRMNTARGEWTVNGPAALTVAPLGSGGVDVSWESNFVVNRGSSLISYRGFLVRNQLTSAGSTGSCTTTLKGALLLDNVQGLTGLVNVATPTPLRFSGSFSNNAAALTLTAGQISLNDDQLTLSVVAPNSVAINVGGTRVKIVPWAYLGGPLREVLAFRPTVADKIFSDGNFFTVADAQPTAQALAVMDGRILAAGTLAEAGAFEGAVTSSVPLHGRTCLPGFVEPHMHVSLTALQRLSTVNSMVVPCGSEELGNTIQAVLNSLTQAVQQNPAAPSIYGFNFDPSRLAGSDLMQNLTLQQLDAISPTIPIVVQNASLHISYANSAAFRLATFNGQPLWPTAPNGPFTPPAELAEFIPVGPDQLPTGQLNERAQDPLINVAISGLVSTPAGAKQYLTQWRLVMNDLAARGITSASDLLTGAALGLNAEQEVFAALALDPTNPCRLTCYIDTNSSVVSQINVFAGEGYERLRYVGAKVVTDGSTQGLTAGLNFNYIFPGPFPVAPNGLMDFASLADLLLLTKPWYDAGFQISFHANGDRALEQVFSAVQIMQAANPRDARTRIEHFTVHQPAALASHVATARDLKLEISHTIGHVFFWGQVFNNTLLGNQVSPNIDPVRSLLQAGVPVSTHSDSPVSTPFPLRNIEILATRLWQAPPGQVQVLGPAEIVPVSDAIKTVTRFAARALFSDPEVGTLEVGKMADLVVLGDDPNAVAPGQISKIPVIATYLEGKQVSGTAP